MSESNPSAWEQIADEIRRQIKAGTLAPGTQLPGRDDLAANLARHFPTLEHLGTVSPSTITRAYGALKFAGLIRGERGVAVWVADDPADTGDAPPG